MQADHDRLTQVDVKRMLDAALQFYDGGPGSSNIMYDDEDGEFQLSEKGLKRNKDAGTAANIKAQTDERIKDMSWVEKGAHLFGNEIKAGNCEEMAAVALHQCLHDDQFNTKMKNAWIVSSTKHTFLVVSDGPDLNQPVPAQGQEPKIGQAFAADVQRDGVWAIDPWMGIACSGNEYLGKFHERTKEWEREGIVVAYDRETRDIQISTKEGERTEKKVSMPDPDELDSAKEFEENFTNSQFQAHAVPLRELHSALRQGLSDSGSPVEPSHASAVGPTESSSHLIPTGSPEQTGGLELHAPYPLESATQRGSPSSARPVKRARVSAAGSEESSSRVTRTASPGQTDNPELYHPSQDSPQKRSTSANPSTSAVQTQGVQSLGQQDSRSRSTTPTPQRRADSPPRASHTHSSSPQQGKKTPSL